MFMPVIKVYPTTSASGVSKTGWPLRRNNADASEPAKMPLRSKRDPSLLLEISALTSSIATAHAIGLSFTSERRQKHNPEVDTGSCVCKLMPLPSVNPGSIINWLWVKRTPSTATAFPLLQSEKSNAKLPGKW
jgi:hypothetical protein